MAQAVAGTSNPGMAAFPGIYDQALEDVGTLAAFAASDRARTLTGTAINLTCGAVVD